MKGIACFVLALVMALGLCACGQTVDTSVPADEPTWQEQYDLGIRYLSEGNYEEAIIAFTAAIEIDPKQADAYIGLADVYTAQGDRDKAEEILKRGMDEATDVTALEQKLQKLSAPLPLDGYPKTERFDMDDGGYIQEEYNEFGLPTRKIVYNADGSIQNEELWEYDENGKLLHEFRSQYGNDFDVISTKNYDAHQRLSSISRDWIEHGDSDGNERDSSRLESHSYTYQDAATVNIQVTLTYRTGQSVQRAMTHSLGSGSRYAEVLGLHWSWSGDQPVDLYIDHIRECSMPDIMIRDLEYEEGVLISTKEWEF